MPQAKTARRKWRDVLVHLVRKYLLRISTSMVVSGDGGFGGYGPLSGMCKPQSRGPAELTWLTSMQPLVFAHRLPLENLSLVED